MAFPPQTPWASGPGEILRHGLELLKKDSDVNRRLALISIDNSVELMIKTFLSLPKRITALDISRKQLQEIGESFPSLLDALERHAPEKLTGIDLGVIEWYHRLRNELYHQGNGLTVERDKVEVYAEIANVLFRNLFGAALIKESSKKTELLGAFLYAWGDIEQGLINIIDTHMAVTGAHLSRHGNLQQRLDAILRSGVMNTDDLHVVEKLRQIRNRAVHAEEGWETELTTEVLEQAEALARRVAAYARHSPRGG